MHSALRIFYQVSHIHLTDFSAVANIDLFPGTQSMFLCSVSGILNPLRSANTHLEQCSSLCGRLHCTHIYAHVDTAQIPSLFVFPAKDVHKSLCHLWMAGAGF